LARVVRGNVSTDWISYGKLHLDKKRNRSFVVEKRANEPREGIGEL